jgi:hypothetical protein
MVQLMNMPLSDYVLREYGTPSKFEDFCRRCGCNGIEAVWGGEDYNFPISSKLIYGWHLAFYCDWLDFWNGNFEILDQKFGGRDMWQRFYGGDSRETLLEFYRNDLKRAQEANAQYVVFHVSDVSVEEGFTYRWLHSDEAVIDAAAEVLNTLLDGQNYSFKLLMENLHWAGFTFTNPLLTERLMEKVNYSNCGIMLDIGHLLCTNTDLQNQREAAEYIQQKLNAHGTLCAYIKGIHLHQSISGSYVKTHTGYLPELPENYFEKYAYSYRHILQIDTHKPWTDPVITEVIARIAPDYLVHELAASNSCEKEKNIRIQCEALLKK